MKYCDVFALRTKLSVELGRQNAASRYIPSPCKGPGTQQ